MRPVPEVERLGLPSYRRLRETGSSGVRKDGIVAGERVQVDVDSFHAQELTASLRAFSRGVAGLRLLGSGYGVLLVEGTSCFGAVADQLLNILLLLADWLPILRLTAVRVADHHVRGVELVDLLVARCDVSVVPDGTLPGRVDVLYLLRTTDWSVHLHHIQVQLFSFHG